MRLLILSPFPFGPHSSHGGAVAANAEFSALRQLHEIAVCAFEHPEPDTKASEYLLQHASRYVGVPLPLGFLRSKMARLHALRRGWPVDACLYSVPAMRHAVSKLMAEFKPEAVIVQFPQMAQYVTELRDVPALMDVQDAYSVSAFRVATTHTGLMRWERMSNWLSWIAYERQHYRQFAQILTLTEQDMIGLRVFTPNLPGHSVGIPVPIPDLTQQTIQPFTVRFVGAFGHKPNIAGVDWFLRRVWPHIHEREPRARLQIGGKNPPPTLLALAGEQVEFVGFVDDLQQFLTTAHVVVVPLISGGGIKIKTLEAMAAGAAVVTTCIGAEGVGGSSGVHYLVDDSAHGFARDTLSVLADSRLRQNLGTAGRVLIAEHYAPKAWAEKITKLVHVAINGRNSKKDNNADNE